MHQSVPTHAEPLEGEALAVFMHRFQEARDAGLTRFEARLFAISTTDVRWLRLLVASGCQPRLIARIVT